MLNKKAKAGIIIMSAMIIPGSGYVILKIPKRGLMMIMWMLAFAYITYHLTSTNISAIGRISGGLMIWVFSVLEISKLAYKMEE